MEGQCSAQYTEVIGQADKGGGGQGQPKGRCRWMWKTTFLSSWTKGLN